MLVRRVLACIVLGLLGALAPGDARAKTLEEVQSCLQANIPRQASAMTLTLESDGKAGWSTTHRGDLYWSRGEDGTSRTLLCLSAPRDVEGLAYLIHEREGSSSVWVYLPDEERSARLHAADAARRARISRTAISYNDLRYVPLTLAGATSRLAEEERLGDRSVTSVELAAPAEEKSPYHRVVARVDDETCVPLEIELWAANGELRKTLRADSDLIRETDGIQVARSFSVVDPANEVRTQVRVEKLAIDPKLDDDLFEPPLRHRDCGRR